MQGIGYCRQFFGGAADLLGPITGFLDRLIYLMDIGCHLLYGQGGLSGILGNL